MRNLHPPTGGAHHPRLGLLAMPTLANRPSLPALPAPARHRLRRLYNRQRIGGCLRPCVEAGEPGLEPRLTGPEPVGLPITPLPSGMHGIVEVAGGERLAAPAKNNSPPTPRTVRRQCEHTFVPAPPPRAEALLGEGVSLAEVARRTGLPYAVVKELRACLSGTLGGPTKTRGSTSQASTRDEIVRLLDSGCSRAEVARTLKISKSTVSYHARRLALAIDERAARRYGWGEVQRYYDDGHSVRECAEHFGFSTATWSMAARRGDVVGRPTMMSIEELLSGPRGRTHLKARLLEAGLLPTHCQICGISSWRGQRLALELHHANGNGNDNRLENLLILCPNCHSQTDSWGGRNSKRTLHVVAGGQQPTPSELSGTARTAA